MAKRKTYKKKSSARRKAHGRSIYKVRGGWHIGKRKRKRRRRKRRGNPRRGCGFEYPF